ncbi:hypothetical protein HELRODRAFT_112400, partial [Helobdella robusta]|uniref:Signal recognition particle subunit SRP68 n=1 Tax=Helobdella robusta TaxID=6412 RepID=T1EFJ6_HELRO
MDSQYVENVNPNLVKASEREAAECVSLEVLQVVKDVQQQHGLRHGDFQRYRQYCSRKLRRIRKVVNFQQGTKHKVQPRKITAETLKDQRCLYIPLMEAERSWAYAMQLKSEANTEPRKHFHMMNRLKKAVHHADHLQKVVADEQANCDARTNLEVKAYCSWMHGLLNFELQHWKVALDNFIKSKVICEKLSEAVAGDVKEIYIQRCAELVPNIRYCEYNIGDVSAVEDLMQMRLNITHEDPLTSKLDELIEMTREKQSSSLSEVTWLARTIPVKNIQVRRLLLSMQQSSNQLRDAGAEQKLSMYESLLKEIIEAQQSHKDEFKDDGIFKALISKMKPVEGQVPSSVYLHTYLAYLRQSTTTERNLLMISLLKSDESKKTKPQDLARLYDVIIQNLSEIGQLPGLEDKEAFLKEVDTQILAYKAFRCFHVAQTYEYLKKYKEALALYDRSVLYAQMSLKQLLKTSIENTKKESLSKELRELMSNVDGLKYFIRASSILDGQNEPDTKVSLSSCNKPLIERLHEYVEVGGNVKKTSLVNLPPEFEPTPAKPFFFDLALSSIDFPSLDDRLEQKKTQGGLTGYFKKWIWGGGEKQ